MCQHVLLLGVVAPLVGLGAPLPTLLWALPDGLRRRALRWWRRAATSLGGEGWWRWLAAALTAHVVTMVGWHAPVLYDLAVRNEVVHGLEHLSFVATAAAMWWTFAGGVRRARWGAGVLSLFVSSLAGIGLGAAMTFARHPWYQQYAAGRHALQEQQIAGVVMWGFGGAVTVVAALVLFGLWLEGLGDPGVGRSTPPLVLAAERVADAGEGGGEE
jgi:putative membrane protein